MSLEPSWTGTRSRNAGSAEARRDVPIRPCVLPRSGGGGGRCAGRRRSCRRRCHRSRGSRNWRCSLRRTGWRRPPRSRQGRRRRSHRHRALTTGPFGFDLGLECVEFFAQGLGCRIHIRRRDLARRGTGRSHDHGGMDRSAALRRWSLALRNHLDDGRDDRWREWIHRAGRYYGGVVDGRGGCRRRRGRNSFPRHVALDFREVDLRVDQLTILGVDLDLIFRFHEHIALDHTSVHVIELVGGGTEGPHAQHAAESGRNCLESSRIHHGAESMGHSGIIRQQRSSHLFPLY